MARQGRRQEQLALLGHLNDCVGTAARRVFQQQLTASQLLQQPQNELQKLLPELCSFVHRLLPPDSGDSVAAPSSALVRRVFSHPDAQWLSRSARQSGVTALMCQQLVRLTHRVTNNCNNIGSDNLYWSAPEMVVQVLLDALLLPCAQRFDRAPEACKWRPTQQKPRFHAMPCFLVWSALLPFVAQLGIRHPVVFQRVLLTHRTVQQRHRSNCDFAHISGLWRLLDEMSSAVKGEAQEVTAVMTALLQFTASEKLLLGSTRAKEEKKVLDAQLDDQLLDKFFTGMQEFSLKCWRGSAIIKPALLNAVLEALLVSSNNDEVSAIAPRVTLFAGVGSIFVNGLAADLVSQLIERLKGRPSGGVENHGPLLDFTVGFCAHLDLVPLPAVLELLDMLMERYKIALQSSEYHCAQERQRLKLVLYVIYVTLHRYRAVDSLRQEVSSKSVALMAILNQFQTRWCSDITFGDFYIAAPVHWTAVVWKHWIFLSDEEVQVFVSEALERDMANDRIAAWQMLESELPFGPARTPSFPRMNTLLRPHLAPSMPLEDPDEERALTIRTKKRRQTAISSTEVDPEQLERSFDVLLLPDVMERVCSFMSAKRLCRMALVCRAFAELSHRATLWRPLYLRLGLSSGKKLVASRVVCHHGENYEHDWRQLYQERWQALRKLRRLQRRPLESEQSSQLDEYEGTDISMVANAKPYAPRICSHCSCDRLLKSASDFEAHLAQHEEFTCPNVSCRASFTAAAKYKQHIRQQHPDTRTHALSKSEQARAVQTRLLCGFEGCTKSYTSAKWLATHRQRNGHNNASPA